MERYCKYEPSEIELSKVYAKYQSARKRFNSARMSYNKELREIAKEYIKSVYDFWEGDIVLFRNSWHETPTLVYIEHLYFIGDDEVSMYKNPRVEASGLLVDEEGYLVTYVIMGKETTSSYKFYAKEVIEKTTIKFKGER